MTSKHKNPPLLGEAFNPEQMNMGYVFQAVADELAYYKPAGFASLNRDLELAAKAWNADPWSDEPADAIQVGLWAITDAEDLLSEWAKSVERHDYIYFEVSGPFAGFRINVESALDDADWSYSCDGSREHGNPHRPGDGAGLEVFCNDHGNVTAWLYGRNGHKSELFSVV